MMQRREHELETVSVPDIEIAAGWPVSEIDTIEDCNDAFAYLMAAVAEIEYQIDQHKLGIVISPDPTWPARATRALKYKRAALQLVGYRRGELGEQSRQNFQNARDRALLDHIKNSVPASQFHAWIVGSGVEAMRREKAA